MRSFRFGRDAATPLSCLAMRGAESASAVYVRNQTACRNSMQAADTVARTPDDPCSNQAKTFMDCLQYNEGNMDQ